MRAAYYEEFRGPLAIRSVPDPEPSLGGVVVRVMATGVCRSDWNGWIGNDPDITLPHVPGHELAGIIEAVGPEVRSWRVGDRVTTPFVCGCGECDYCRSGDQQVCPDQFQPGFTAWGSFAEFVMLDYAEENLVRLPEGLDFVTAASLGCRFASSFRAVVAQGRTREGEWIAVHGCGGVGLSAVMIAQAIGARVVAIDTQDSKLALAQDFGAEAVVMAGSGLDVSGEVTEITGGGAHVSIDAVGSAVTATNSIRSLRRRGRHVQVGLMTGAAANLAAPFGRIVSHELEILGSHGMQAHRYPDLMAMIADGRLHPELLVGRTVTMEEALSALVSEEAFVEPGILVIDRI